MADGALGSGEPGLAMNIGAVQDKTCYSDEKNRV
jgi:hypothetical protein